MPELVTDTFTSGVFVGKADFYAFRLGRFLMGINSTEDRSYTLKTPTGFTSATELISNKTPSGTISVAPTSSVVLVLTDTIDTAPIPGTPLLVRAAITDSSLVVTWSAATGAQSDTVKRATTLDGPYATIASGIVDTTFVDTTAMSSTSDYYKVSGESSAGEGYDSTAALGTT